MFFGTAVLTLQTHLRYRLKAFPPTFYRVHSTSPPRVTAYNNPSTQHMSSRIFSQFQFFTRSTPEGLHAQRITDNLLTLPFKAASRRRLCKDDMWSAKSPQEDMEDCEPFAVKLDSSVFLHSLRRRPILFTVLGI